jgi:hypothetical protein
MFDGLLVVGSFVGLHTFVELVAGSEFAAPDGTQQRGCDGQHRHKSCASVHVLLLLAGVFEKSRIFVTIKDGN